MVFHTDGLVEAHNPQREFFGLLRLRHQLAQSSEAGAALLARLLDELARFCGAEWEQEDDITLLTLQRATDAPRRV